MLRRPVFALLILLHHVFALEIGSSITVHNKSFTVSRFLTSDDISDSYMIERTYRQLKMKIFKSPDYSIESPHNSPAYFRERDVLAHLGKLQGDGVLENGHPYILTRHQSGLVLKEYIQRYAAEHNIQTFANLAGLLQRIRRAVQTAISNLHQARIAHIPLTGTSILISSQNQGIDLVAQFVDLSTAEILQTNLIYYFYKRRDDKELFFLFQKPLKIFGQEVESIQENWNAQIPQDNHEEDE